MKLYRIFIFAVLFVSCQNVEKVEEPSRGMVKENPAEFLDMMIMKALVLQEARKQGIQPGKEEKGEEEAIQQFLQKKLKKLLSLQI